MHSERPRQHKNDRWGAAFGFAPERCFAISAWTAVAATGNASVALVNGLRAVKVTSLGGLVRAWETECFTPPGEDADLDSLPSPSLHRWSI